MEEKKYVAFLRSYYDAIKELPRKSRAELALAIIEYGFEGIIPQLSGASKMAFVLIQPTMDKSEEMRQTVKARWDKKKASSYDTQNDAPYDTQNDMPYDTQNDVPYDTPSLNKKKENREREKENGEYNPPNPPAGDEEDAEDAQEDPDFAAFWEVYPRKTGKGAARKAFAKVPKSKRKLLVPAVLRQKTCDQWTRDNGQYIPLPATWLNQERWDDGGTEVPDRPRTSNPFLAMAMEMED